MMSTAAKVPASSPYDRQQITVALTAPGNPLSHAISSPIAGSVLPLAEAERQLRTLPGVLDVRIVPSETGAVSEVHVVTTMEVSPKATVRNVETMLKASLKMSVDHRKISVATSNEKPRDRRRVATKCCSCARHGARTCNATCQCARKECATVFRGCRNTAKSGQGRDSSSDSPKGRSVFRWRVRRPRECAIARGARGERSAAGDRADRAQRGRFVVEGCKVIEAFDREFMFVGISVRVGRENALLTGSCEIKDSPETASVLAVLDATNRWVSRALILRFLKTIFDAVQTISLME